MEGILALTCLELLTWKDKYSRSPRWHWDPTCPRPGQIWGSVTKVRLLMSPPHLNGATQTCRTQELSQCQGWRNGGTLSCRVCSMELTWGERAGPEPPWCHQMGGTQLTLSTLPMHPRPLAPKLSTDGAGCQDPRVTPWGQGAVASLVAPQLPVPGGSSARTDMVGATVTCQPQLGDCGVPRSSVVPRH